MRNPPGVFGKAALGLLLASIVLPAGPVRAQGPWGYTALGDSICYGLWASPGGSYPSQYRGFLQTDNGVTVNVDNQGVIGWTSTDLLNALQTNNTIRASVAAARVITWDIGGNDLLDARDSYKAGTCGGADGQNCLRAAIVAFKTNWNAIVDQIFALRANGTVRLQTMDVYNPYVNTDRAANSWPSDGGLNDFQATKPYIDEMNNFIRVSSASRGIPYAKVYTAFNGLNGDIDAGDRGYLSFIDGLHPNTAGHTVIATGFRTATTVTRPARVAEQFDFDADGRTDLTVFRPGSGTWYLLTSSASQFSAVPFGSAGDRVVPGDYDGDGKTDIAVFRPSAGAWYILNSSDNSFRPVAFGLASDLPVPDDYDGDGRTDIAVFRDGAWYLLRSSDNAFVSQSFGAAGDRPAPGDFDGDGRTDLAIFRPSSGTWYRLSSANGVVSGTQFGANGDLPVAGDFDGDLKADIAIFRPSAGAWYYLRSSNGAFAGVQFGASGDVPVPGDFDGDGKADTAVFRPSDGYLYIINSATNSFRAASFGANGDLPAPVGTNQ
jgi:lysophospholipase L1-like esterase